MRTSLLKILPAVAPEKTGWPWLEETSVCEFNFDINYPKITIITPSFNQGDFIEETIRSVLLQNYPNLEYFIMDGGSTDESVDIIKKYEPFITYFESKKDNGQSHAINKGLAKTTGDIVTWLNSDDYYNAGTLFEIANEFIQQVNCNCVIGKSHVFGDGKSYIAKSPLFESVEKTIGFGRIVQPAMFFKTNLYNQIGLLNEQLHYLIDTEWWLKYLMIFGLNQIVEIEKTVVNFRLHPISKTLSQEIEFIKERDSIYYSIAIACQFAKLAQTIDYFKLVNKKYKITLPKKTQKQQIEKSLHYFLLLRGNEFYAALDKKNAAHCFKQINSRLLLKADIHFLKKIMRRNTFIPKFIIQFFRKK